MKKRVFHILICVCVSASLFTACKSSRTAVAPPQPKEARHLSSKLQVTIPGGGGSLTAGGTMRLKEGERVQISLLMPLIRSEIARIEITPNDALLIDRMNKRYARISRMELEAVLPPNANYSTLERLLFEASQPNGRAELNGKELGIPLLENTRVKLYEFSSAPFLLNESEISDKYTPVPLPVLLKMLTEL